MVMIPDPVGDLLIRIKNGYLARKIEVSTPHSSFAENIVAVLLQYEFIEDVSIKEQDGKKTISVFLKYDEKKNPALEQVKQLSKPGRRVYSQAKDLYSVRGGYGILLVSTSKGVMIGDEAKDKSLGGELLAEIY